MLRDVKGKAMVAYRLRVGDMFTYSGNNYDVLYRVCEHTYDPHGFHGVRATYTKPDLTTGRQGFDGRIDVRLIERRES